MIEGIKSSQFCERELDGKRWYQLAKETREIQDPKDLFYKQKMMTDRFISCFTRTERAHKLWLDD